MVKRYKEVFNPNHSQECICHRGPINRGLVEDAEGGYVDYEDYEKLQSQLAKANERERELVEQVNSLQAAYGRMVDEHFEEKKDLHEQLAKANGENARLATIKKEWESVFLPIEKYCKENDLTPLGHSYTKSLVDSHALLTEQLAKANERVDELNYKIKCSEDFIATARSMFFDLDEMDIDSKEYANGLDDLFTLFCGGEDFKKYINKFAIEQQDRAISAAIDLGLIENDRTTCDSIREQLRKEQEQ